MLRMKKTLGAAALATIAVAVIGITALAHHVDQPLSYIHGENVLDEVNVMHGVDLRGIPAYVVSADEFEGTFALADGDEFFVTDSQGNEEEVHFHDHDFVDIGNATPDEVLDAINKHFTLGVAFEHNGYLVIEGLTEAGEASSLTLTDGAGSPLDALHIAPGTYVGEKHLELVLSTPRERHDGAFAHHRFLMLASATEGSSRVQGMDLPVELDELSFRVFDAIERNQLPELKGRLGHSGDGIARITDGRIERAFEAAGDVDELYFFYVVLEEDEDRIAFVSNRFTVRRP